MNQKHTYEEKMVVPHQHDQFSIFLVILPEKLP